VLTICLTKCPATFLGVAGAMVVIVSAAHVLMVPILPSSLNYFSTHDSISRSKNMLPGVGMANSRLKGQFPSNSYGVVVFRGLKLRLEGRLLGAM
jgi:putative beta-1,4-xylosyltransferase IRX10